MIAIASLKAKSWREPTEDDDGIRILVAHFWPRRLHWEDAPWVYWMRDAGPSPHLHASRSGKLGPPISRQEYVRRYTLEMQEGMGRKAVLELARRMVAGRDQTLVCLCEDEARCHRDTLMRLVEAEAERIEKSLKEHRSRLPSADTSFDHDHRNTRSQGLGCRGR